MKKVFNIISYQESTTENLNKLSLYAFTRMAKTIQSDTTKFGKNVVQL